MLCRMDLLPEPYIYVSAYFEKHEEEYKDLLLRVSTHASWVEWVRFFLRAVETQAVDAAERVDRLLALWREYASRITSKRTSVLQRKLIDQLFMTPAVTVPQVRELLHVSDTAARNHIAAIKDLGILVDGPLRGHTRYYLASEVLRTASGD